MDKDVKVLLKKLNKETGLRLEIAEADVEDDTSLRLQELLLSVKDHSRRDLFWQNLLLGQLSREEAILLSHRFHMDMSAPRVLFLVAFSEPADDISASLLKKTLGKRDEYIELDDRHIVILKGSQDIDPGDEAYSMSDLILTEAMVSAGIAYDRPVDDIFELPVCLKHCEAALRLSALLPGDGRVISYGDLSFEKLLYSVSEDAAREFLSESIPDADLFVLDNEMKNTIRTLFENELNIADTAKALFIHRNTLVYRLEKFQKQTGLDLKRFDDAVICRTALILSELYGTK
ncbi:MAG: helix-turn-helix domain-containing protein [Lachnospiraceae bacterium]|nr:helix-turn-helix domain-containing protein [Lachnospiraceae bacterium]